MNSPVIDGLDAAQVAIVGAIAEPTTAAHAPSPPRSGRATLGQQLGWVKCLLKWAWCRKMQSCPSLKDI
jgi:hypothetical protein